MPTYTIPPDTRTVGTGNPPVDFDTLDDVVSLLTGIAPGGTITTGQVPLTANTFTLTAISGTATTALDAEGSTNGAGQLAFIKNTSLANGDHALTVNQNAAGFDNTAAGNFTSASTLSSTVYISGQATQHGVLKLNHTGQAGGTDTTASALAIDLGSVAGTAAQGIALITTTPTTGNLLLLRNNTLDNFVVKGNGTVAIGVAIGHTPTGMLEIAQQDTSTVGLAMTAIAAGTDMISLKDSGGGVRFTVNNAGNAVMRANAFVSTNLQIGSVSSDFGGSSACISIKHVTDPSTNPTGGCIIYVDASGNLLARTSAGNVRTIAAV